MGTTEIVDLSSDDECGDVNLRAVKLEPDVIGRSLQPQTSNQGQIATHLKSLIQSWRQGSDGKRSPNALSTGHSSSSVLDHEPSPVDDAGLSSTSPMCPAPICRQFWKAGNYDDGLGSRVKLQNAKNHLYVHPMFLHSNATSHKWAFGAIAELLDNAVDEIQNGATFVIVDKTSNPRDGNPALLIQDDGSGMCPEAMHQCMSFGFSDKKSKTAIGQYGNGFKTSTMRLGADVIVFSRHLENSVLTQSIGLLSYTFLTRTGHDRIVVPMVHYEFNTSTGSLDILHGREYFMSNLAILLQWSPYSSEAELLKQFDDIGSHGTKVIVFNLWFNNDGNMELDFDSDHEDICLAGDTKKIDSSRKKTLSEQHIANRFHYSLRVYSSILYLRMPESFKVILRGKVVEPHNIVDDLKYPEFILYEPKSGGLVEAKIVTTIGFLKEAPHVNIHGFNIYHKNRLILPFWQVVSYSNSRGRGVVGVLQADFIEPTHNKQDFERTSLFQKLEVRLKEMTWEYWDTYCVILGYQPKKKKEPQGLVTPKVSSYDKPHGIGNPVTLIQKKEPQGLVTPKVSSYDKPHGIGNPVTLIQSLPLVGSRKAAFGRTEQVTLVSKSEQGLHMKRKAHGELMDLEKVKKQAGKTDNVADVEHIQPVTTPLNQMVDQEAINLMQENKKLRLKCQELGKREEDLNDKVTLLRSEIKEVHSYYDRLLAELQSLDTVKEEKV
ncbi:protein MICRORCHIDIA 6 [Quillaja saponaria]|uniref:Protein MICRORCHIDIA 6 n=1 Tax=Quillaja saponaria TaxID=32244 RepID=A0AAD7LDM9_QUISA|nr:protein MICRORCHIDIA 6 [Quillaja saponaria]